jgi:hypothetical protein
VTEDPAVLPEILREELARRLTQAGWFMDVAFDAGRGGLFLGAFRRPLTGDFWVTAQFIPMNRSLRDNTLEVMGVVGVSYFPAYCLWPILIEMERSELTIDLGQLEGSSEKITTIKVSGPEDVPRAANQIVAPILEHGVAWAMDFTSVEALLGHVKNHPSGFGTEAPVEVVLLAISGRQADARDALATYMASPNTETTSPTFKRFSYEFTRWLDAGAVVPGPPTGPVGPRIRPRRERSREEVAQKHRARREAEDVVLRHGACQPF